MLALLSATTSAVMRVPAPFHRHHVVAEVQVFADTSRRSTEDPLSGLAQHTILTDANRLNPGDHAEGEALRMLQIIYQRAYGCAVRTADADADGERA